MSVALQTEWTVSSPTQKLRVELKLNQKGELKYKVFNKSGATVIGESCLGIKTADMDFYDNMFFVSTDTLVVNNTYVLPNRKKSVYVDYYVQRELAVKKHEQFLTVLFRVYDDGIAFRYCVQGNGNAHILHEYSEFNLAETERIWGSLWTPEYESDFMEINKSELSSEDYTMPMLFSLKNNSNWLLLTEANLYNADASYCVSVLHGDAERKMTLAFSSQQKEAVVTPYPFSTPQRIAIITDTLDELVNSTLVDNANPECKIPDTSFIKPGRAAWSWWSEDYYDSIEFTCARQKEYVDFAASMGWEYVTVDAGWNDWKEGSIAELCEYAAQKGIGIFIWANGNVYRKPEYETPDNRYYGNDFIDEDTGKKVEHIKTWAGWGIKGIKVDFMMDDSQSKMKIYQEIIELCTRHKLMVNFHGSTKPGGEIRTWPNVITSEGVRGSEHYLEWFPTPTPRLNCIEPFTRNVIGSMDQTPVVISNANKNTTQGHQLALAIINQSGIQHFADSIDVYAAWSGTELMRHVPAVWDEVKIVDGFPGEYCVMARRNGSDWYIGAITVEERTVEIPLTFLQTGIHPVYIYKDGKTGEYLQKMEKQADADTVLHIPLLSGGGCAILISDTLIPDMPGDGYQEYEAESPENTLSGTAIICDNDNCSGGKKVSKLGNNEGELQFNHIFVPEGEAGEYSLKLYYLCDSERWITCSVNGGEGAVFKIIPFSGSFQVMRIFKTKVILKEGNNTLRFYHDTLAPDIDKITIARIPLVY